MLTSGAQENDQGWGKPKQEDKLGRAILQGAQCAASLPCAAAGIRMNYFSVINVELFFLIPAKVGLEEGNNSSEMTPHRG